MGKWIRRFRIGWYGWTFIGISFVTLTGSIIFFFHFFHLNLSIVWQDDAVTEEVHTSAAIETENLDVKGFVAQMHQFYKEAIEYGGINHLNMDKQTAQAEKIASILHKDQFKSLIDKNIQMKLNRIKLIAEHIITKADVNDVKKMHQIFHDLDSILNNYKEDKLKGITKTTEKDN